MSEVTQIGHYLIKSLLRNGRSADSYLAENSAMRSQKVLLRVLHEDTAADPAFVRGFMDEVRTAARLDHNCIAVVLDLKNDGERVYAVLEFIEGMNLDELRERFGSPPPEVAAAIMHQVCGALEHAHGKSILHRRLRPRLIKVTPEGGVKVLGFGLRERESSMESAVVPDAMRDELYRPAEQVREEPEDGRADLYTLAVIIHELLTGQLPFDTMIGPAGKAPPRLAAPIFELNPLVPTAFARLLGRLLSERLEDRAKDAAEVRRALDDLLESQRVMHPADLLRSYLGNPPAYIEQAKRQAVDHLMRDAESLSKGGDADRRAALEELERVLAADPNHRQAQSLIRRLKPSSDPGRPPAPVSATSAPPPPAPAFDPDATMLDIPGQEPPPRRAAPPPPAAPLRAATPPPPRAPEPARAPAAPRREAGDEPAPARPASTRASAPAADPAAKWRGLMIGVGAAVVVLAIAVALFVFHPWAPSTTPSAEPVASEESRVDSLTQLAVESEPAGALVLLPGTGETHPTPASFGSLKPGPTRVRVMLGGYRTLDTTLSLTAGIPGALHLSLVPAVSLGCTLFVAVSPKADRVLVDGLAATPVDSARWWMSVAPGTHSVEVTAPGYLKWNQMRAARVAAGGNARLSVLLEQDPAAVAASAQAAARPDGGGDKPWQVLGGTKVTVECEPEAQLFVDGVQYPTLVRNADLSMGPGEHQFRFVHPDFAEAVKVKSFKRSQRSAKIKHDFRVGHGTLSIFSPSLGAQVFVRGKFKGYANLVVRDVDPGRCVVELRDKSGTKVLGTKEVMVADSSVPIEVKF